MVWKCDEIAPEIAHARAKDVWEHCAGVRRAARRGAGGFRRRFDRPLRQDLKWAIDLVGHGSRFGGRPPRGPHAPFHLHNRCLPPPPFRCPGARTMVNDSLLTMCVRHPAAAEPEEQKEPRAAVVD
jgi:hypothetical protein